ncbi:uncharacterized protein LOC107433054 isoform X1 [Ziziphus jujuba]|uniref:Uncharacterized protein LOC107433054 isoform X1 n=4 Tax=Ziziphus jujuba TaxID=326968 RepID=A0A6P6FKQ1_ZIZJJ|nr:uncharacterized protein LOC107433054 isoform X1 [Ziziphus jujuba]XP_024922277.3 uncharacterized protein LOC107433054 isoform X1 [Ziziphus jujuba]XP_048320879.2 uncharacterized protein LOC107433054 isoform X1 [Ziziphus jujuba]XP_060668614.1 uncharacterized protein LOC107433054 isoform X1 [Ziziphus jujuba]
MLLHSWSVYPCSSSSSLKLGLGSLQNLLIGFKNPKRSYISTRPRAQFSQEIAQLVQNKVLIAAGASAAIGQLSKPFTSVLLYGRDFDLKAVIRAGGFPSTHSSAVVATATCLGLERGLSDSIFGLTIVYAGLIMYDAQGVRREVGIHAKTLNKVLQAKPEANNINDNIPTRQTDTIDYFQSGILESRGPKLSKEGRYVTSKPANALLVSKSENETKQSNEVQIPCGVAGDIVEERNMNSFISTYPLKESVGHTEVEVAAGALLGFLKYLQTILLRSSGVRNRSS